jgi:hypothetical protein
VRAPGVEPGPTAWKATILTVRLCTPIEVQVQIIEYIYYENPCKVNSFGLSHLTPTIEEVVAEGVLLRTLGSVQCVSILHLTVCSTPTSSK